MRRVMMDDGVALFQEQLGLKLEKRNALIDVIVIEEAEKKPHDKN
jgi:uncharacterized protein (TIGR03435 family)